MHPMPVCSVSGGDIFDCIQRGNVEQCVHLIQTDRSVLKQKGKIERNIMREMQTLFWSGLFFYSHFICETIYRPLLPIFLASSIVYNCPYVLFLMCSLSQRAAVVHHLSFTYNVISPHILSSGVRMSRYLGAEK